jgi:hypothetical protein
MLMPCCLYAGEIDPIYPEVEACSQHIPRVTFFSLPGLSPCEAYVRSELVLPRVTGFFNGLTDAEGRDVMTFPEQLPAIITPGALATPTDTFVVVPALIADVGEAAAAPRRPASRRKSVATRFAPPG